MGADVFSVRAYGDDEPSAFNDAVADAIDEYGNGGYTGSLAEKSSFHRYEPVASMKEARSLANRELDNSDSPVDDKWGPAGIVHITGTNQYVIFGWAPS
jgi:hypothetical protein